MYVLRSCICVYVFLALSFSAQAHTHRTALFLGNSYTGVNNLPGLVQDLAAGAGDTLVVDSYTPGGITLAGHCADPSTLDKIASTAWNAVVVQAQSQEPSFPPEQVELQTLPYAVRLDSIIRANDSCTTTVFYETWGRKNGDQQNCAFYPPVCTYEGMQGRLRDSYKLFADTCKTLMAPVGEAWKQVIQGEPSINLYQPDESHPTIEGSYLAACVLYEVIFEKSVVGNPYSASINNAVATLLQQMAHKVVQDSSTTWNIGKYPRCAGTTSVTDNIQYAELTVYPNPASYTIDIRAIAPFDNSAVSYSLLDMHGVEVLKGTSRTIDIGALPCGTYLLVARLNNQHHTTMVVKTE